MAADDRPTPPHPPDLLIVGGLTIDRFADRSAAPGGSVFHVARALGRSASLAVVTIAGDEPMAQAGLTELRLMATRVICRPAARTIAFRHDRSGVGRRMWLDSGDARISAADLPSDIAAPAILFAPVADEIAPDALAAGGTRTIRGAILQGWLRLTDQQGEGEVQPRSLAALDDDLQAALAGMDLLVASREDLRADGDDGQLDLLRGRFPAVRLLVVTDAVNDVWVDLRDAWRWRAPVPRVVATPATIGVGDVFAAALMLGYRRDDDPTRIGDAIGQAMETTARWLESRSA